MPWFRGWAGMEDFMNKFGKKAAMSGMAVCLAGITGLTSLAATEHWNDNSAKSAISYEWEQWKTKWESIKTDYEKISLSPGADASKMNYAWYSRTADQAKIRISKTADMTTTVEANGVNTYKENVTEFSGTSVEYKKIDDVTYYANKVTATGLESDTVYYYQYFLNGKWSEVKSLRTGNTDNFSFMYVGDPQIGASKGQIPSEAEDKQTNEIAARNDAFSWNKTLNVALNNHPEIDFIVSAGDQINNTSDDNGQELEYAGLLAADAMPGMPIAATIGNHDSKFANYQNHFNVPNPYKEEQNATPAGNDYYYSYGDALFIVLNTNNYNCAAHEALIKKAIASAPSAKWKIVTFHQDIYGSGLDHSDSDGIVLRTQLTTIFDKYDIDVVLQGHDHTYSRSYMLTSDGKEHTVYSDGNIKEEYTDIKDNQSDDAAALGEKKEFLEQNLCYKIADKRQGTINNPEGVLYMEANSATGSKYYNLISTQQDYIANRSQTWTPSYSVIDITGDSLTVNTYDVNSNKAIDQTFTITKREEDNKNTSQPVAVSTVQLNKSKVTLKVGQKVTIKATIKPDNATDKNVEFTSSKKEVATVNPKGIVTAKKAGTATIMVKAGNKKAVCKVTVKKK